jgi:hypothetical protein
MHAHDRWSAELLDEKPADASFPLAFVRSNVSRRFLYRQYQQAKAGIDDGYCLGDETGAGRCLACGACPDDAGRSATLGHRINPPPEGYLRDLEKMMTTKWRLQPIYVRVRLPPVVAGGTTEWMNAWVLKGLLEACPELLDNLLTARESLFTVGDNQERLGPFYGETVCALTGWDVQRAADMLVALPRQAVSGLEILSTVEGFSAGVFERATLSFVLVQDHFPEAGRMLVEFLRANYVPCNLRRAGSGYVLDLPEKALKKRTVFKGAFQEAEGHVAFHLVVGPKFDLVGYLRSFDGPDRSRGVSVAVSQLIC